MKQLKKSRGSSTAKASFNKRCFGLVALLSLVIVIFGIGIYRILPTRDTEPRVEVVTTGEIDFTNPEIMVHTADGGIAIVGGNPSGGAMPVSAPASNQPARFTADPATIWSGEAAPVHTHGGFTLPVQMDGEAIGVLNIPDIGLTARIYEGLDEMESMERGVAHFRSTSAWYGAVGLSAHNINLDGTPGYFLHLYTLPEGAVIRYQTAFGTREYLVQSITEICQYDWSLLDRTEDNRLVLITCITGRPDLRLAVVAAEG